MIHAFFYIVFPVFAIMEEPLRQPEFGKLREKMDKVLHDSFDNYDFQVFMSVVSHAITCKDCSKEFYHSISIAKEHLYGELK